jgi:transketolase
MGCADDRPVLAIVDLAFVAEAAHIDRVGQDLVEVASAERAAARGAIRAVGSGGDHQPLPVQSLLQADLAYARPAAEKSASLKSPGDIIGDAPVKVAIEAAICQGWDAVIGADGAFLGMSSFGASAPYNELYKHFGITPDAVVEAVMRANNLA